MSGAVWLPASALASLIEQARDWSPLETGGVLVGYRVDHAVVVTDLVGPGPDAEHRSSGFVPDAAHHRARIAELYERSGRHDAYLGDWHSHPAGGTALSRRDRWTLRRIGRTASARCSQPVMVIVALGESPTVAAWVAVAQRCRRLAIIPSPVRPY